MCVCDKDTIKTFHNVNNIWIWHEMNKIKYLDYKFEFEKTEREKKAFSI